MAQGERYDAKTKTGWKFENGRSNYYLNGKKLSQSQIIRRGLKPLTDTIGKVFEPITSGAKNIATGNVTFLRHPDSPTGESRQAYNARIEKEKLAIQKKFNNNPNVKANQTAASTLNPNQYFGVGKYGDKTTQFQNLNADIPENKDLFKGQMLISNGQLVQAGSPGFGLKIDKVSNQGSTSEVEVGNTNSQALTSGQATPKAPIVQEKETRQALRSDVFTLDENNVPLGVMTRAQRRAWDANPDNQKLMRRRKEELRIHSRTYSSGNIGTGSG